MRLSRDFQILKMIFKERYREPTLEVIFSTMIVSNVFITAFYARALFSLYGIVLAFIPLISVSETIAFAIGMRNIIFVTGDHIARQTIVSFLTFPISRIKLFSFIYITDLLVPYLCWLSSTEIYILLSGIDVPQGLILLYSIGYFFSLNLILLITLTMRSSGLVTLFSGFVLGVLFVFGGIAEYYEIISNNLSLANIISFANPYVILLYQAIRNSNINYFNFGVIIEFITSLVLLVISIIKFKELEV
ncbi:hypothetical protein BFU36_07925 [Sulfolobus sp. A20]|uniref:hypothetical protein n=1 Tax=Sulfolobaceae TaxID=118883 RepID=UPI000846261A|nr:MULTISPECIES: hypothetical protein [unclassified Sulfolobus]TRM75805.1 hypothetical protein DJ532_09250 [Sulfolobus sp. A20-N-F8]TRM78615.1 hypothetical protein DJ528_04540 [Sulfolobus sp. B5]TRM83794.1 hypothetical protein DJ531_03740 [Sulfolobus sp. A20-N-F6]TRM84523.1 hypothetical protein DJ522_04435 [Sulfolobus sp. F3]TRM88183.1 hypothetical protein DJ521_02325 [Sulfolobus sp. E3]TRM89699.1 hypothetical protein DJ529_01100 [Sulfolobus sp. C3]TRM99237.1 hypothetical protein DJ530_09315